MKVGDIACAKNLMGYYLVWPRDLTEAIAIYTQDAPLQQSLALKSFEIIDVNPEWVLLAEILASGAPSDKHRWLVKNSDLERFNART